MPRITNIEMLQQPEQPALVIKARANVQIMGELLGASFAKIGQYLNELGELVTDIPFIVFPDYAGMDEKGFDIIITFPLAKAVPGKGDIESVIIPAQKIVFCMYRGAYEQMLPVYAEMEEWIKKNGYEKTGASREYYYNGADTPEEDLLTKVVMPLK